VIMTQTVSKLANKVIVFIFLPFVFLLFPFLAEAQLSTTGTITITVTDQTGAAVPGANIVVTNAETNSVSRAVSNNVGMYSIVGLSVGTYNISVTKAGFSTYNETGIYVGPAAVRNVNAVLTPATIVTTVNVAASTVQVQTSTGEISSQIAEQQIGTLPLNGRSYQGLSALMPGVANLTPGQAQGPGGFATDNTMSINGMGASGTLYTLDGIWNMNTGWMLQTTITPNPDEIQEIRVLQNNYSPKYSLMGSNVVLIETKSGTRAFHGDAWEYLRNDALDARNFFSPTVPPLKQNIFGYDIGGPFYVPGVYNTDKEKTFVYWNQQWVRQNAGSVLRGATPTADMRRGIFNEPITNPETGQAFPQTSPGVYQIPSSMINPNSQAFLQALEPLPNNPAGGFLNYINVNPAILDQRDDEIKADQNLSSKFRLMGEYFDERQTQRLPAQEWIGSPFNTNYQVFTTDNQLAQLRLTQMLSSSMVNQTSIAMNNYVVNLAIDGITQPSQVPGFSSTLPFHGFNSDFLPSVSFAGGWSPTGVQGAFILHHASDLEDTVSDDWTWLRGHHFFQSGATVILGTKRQNSNAGPPSNGSFYFSGQFTGNPIADFLLGDATSFAQSSTQIRYYAHYPLVSPYFEDRWKATSRLTLSVGVRMLFMPWAHDQRGFEPAFDPAKFDPAKAPIVNPDGTITPTPNFDPTNGIIFNGENGVPLNLTTAHQYYWGPSVGFAWDVFGDGRTALRGGYGITYNRSATSSDCAQSCVANYPLIDSVTLINPSFPNPAGALAAPLTVRGLSTEDLANLQAMQVQSFSLSLEHQFGPNWLVSIAGAGDIARHLPVGGNINQPLPMDSFDFNPIINTGTVSSAFYAPYQGYSAIGMITSSGNAYWDALEFNVRHPIGHNFFLTAAYTWSHNLSNVLSGQYGYTASSFQNSYAPSSDYGNSPLNVPQVFTTSLIYSLPWFLDSKGWRGNILGGWKFSDISTIQSGFSLTPSLAIAHPGLANRPDAVGHLSEPKVLNQWFSTNTFAAPPYGFYGNAGPGSIGGPGVINFDMALYKDFHINERNVIQFRGEFFNIFNHSNFSTVDTAFGSGSYGKVIGARDPRILEFALRYRF
jgi:hypothetical protein